MAADNKNKDEKGASVNVTGKPGKVGLMAKLTALTHLFLEFTGITVQKDKDKNLIAILQLATPIPSVRSTQEFDTIGGGKQALVLNDVTEVKVHQKDFENDPGFEFDENTDTGIYKGSNLSLDVSRSGQVWLVSTNFATASSDFRNKARADKLQKLFEGTRAASNGTPEKVKPVTTS
jgi:hypothetical protein